MRFLFISICLVLSCNFALSQQVEIFGKVTDNEGQPLPGATINYQEKLGTIVDLNGNFHIEAITSEPIRLTIRFIGFTTVDTLINFDNKSEVYLQIQMTPELSELPGVEITSTYQNIFKNYKHHIVDFTITGDIIYLIIKKGRKSFLCTASLKGLVLEEHALKGGYNKFHNSCLGGIILVGSEHCAELHTVDNKLLITNRFSIDYYNKYIVPCKLEMDENLFFKGISRHNKKIDFFTYKEPGIPIIIHSVYDQVGARVSQSYFNDILREYFKASENVELEDIDLGFERDNIIADGSWNGDIQDLIITNNTHELVLQYQALGQKEVQSDLFVVDGKIYILDQLNKVIFKIEDDFETANVDCLFTLDKEVSIISDYEDDTYFQHDDDLYAVTPNTDELGIRKVKTLDHVYFTDRVVLYEGILYRLGRKSIDNVRKTIFRDDLD